MNIKIWYLDWEKHSGRVIEVHTEKPALPVKSEYDCVHDTTYYDDTEARVVCDEMFERFNIGDHGGKNIRSMSVGDIVQVGNKNWMCRPMGWAEVQWG